MIGELNTVCSQRGETCKFDEHFRSLGVNHILASVKTTTGKLEDSGLHITRKDGISIP